MDNRLKDVISSRVLYLGGIIYAYNSLHEFITIEIFEDLV